MTIPLSDPGKVTATYPPPLSEHIGDMIAVVVRKCAFGVEKSFGIADVAYCDMFGIVGNLGGIEFLRTELSNKKLVSQLSEKTGELVVGRIAYGEGAKGKKPIVLAPLSAEDRELAQRWYQSNQAKVDRALASAKAEASREPATAAAGGGSWGTPPPPPPATPPF